MSCDYEYECAFISSGSHANLARTQLCVLGMQFMIVSWLLENFFFNEMTQYVNKKMKQIDQFFIAIVNKSKHIPLSRTLLQKIARLKYTRERKKSNMDTDLDQGMPANQYGLLVCVQSK